MATFVKAWLAAFALQFGLSALWYGYVMVERYAVWEAAVARPEQLWLYAFLGQALFLLVMAKMYPIGYQGGDPLLEGARFGLMVGLLLTGFGLIIYGAYELQFAGVAADFLFNIVVLTLAGAVIGKVYGPKAEDAEINDPDPG